MSPRFPTARTLTMLLLVLSLGLGAPYAVAAGPLSSSGTAGSAACAMGDAGDGGAAGCGDRCPMMAAMARSEAPGEGAMSCCVEEAPPSPRPQPQDRGTSSPSESSLSGLQPSSAPAVEAPAAPVRATAFPLRTPGPGVPLYTLHASLLH